MLGRPARKTRAQVPRTVTTNLPVTLTPPAGRVVLVRVAAERNRAVGVAQHDDRPVLPLAKMALLEFWTVIVVPPVSARVADRDVGQRVGRRDRDRAFGYTAGALVMYGVGPALPEAATTTMPAAAALATAGCSARCRRRRAEVP